MIPSSPLHAGILAMSCTKESRLRTVSGLLLPPWQASSLMVLDNWTAPGV